MIIQPCFYYYPSITLLIVYYSCLSCLTKIRPIPVSIPLLIHSGNSLVYTQNNLYRMVLEIKKR